MMIEQEHANLVARLSKPGEEIIEQLDALKATLLHAAIGIAGEAGELIQWAVNDYAQENMENFVEELGDMEFFLQMARGALGYDRDAILDSAQEVMCFTVGTDRVGCAALLSAHACVFLDAVKKFAIYDAPLIESKLVDAMLEIEAALVAIRVLHYTTREETLRHNIDKLNKRYHSGAYSNAQAQARADKET